jgi:hypothetical protein
MIKTYVFLSLLFVTEDGSVVPGNNVPGWSDLYQPTLELCLKRSKYMYKHPMFPKPYVSVVSFCRVIHEFTPEVKNET